MPLQITDLTNENVTAEILAQTIVGRGIEISNATFTGSDLAAAIFSDDLDPSNPESIVLREGFTEVNIVETVTRTETTTVTSVDPDTGQITETEESRELAETINGDTLFRAEEEFILTDGLFDGVGLSTGDINGIIDPNILREPPFQESTSFGLQGDPLLEAEISPEPTNDAAVLEFDFVPDLETLLFRFIFASEEYDAFDNRQFNDAFAFFLTGPSQDGNNFFNKNIALIPETELPVTVNGLTNTLNFEPPVDPDTGARGTQVGPILLDNTLTNINAGSITTDAGNVIDAEDLITLTRSFDPDFDDAAPESDPFPDPNQETDREYLLNNALVDSGGSIFEFDLSQLTTILEAQADGIIPGETYHAKIVIADTFDDLIDSAVFIENQDQTRLQRENGTLEPFINLDQIIAVLDNENTRINTPVTIDVLANDVDPQRDPLDINVDPQLPVLVDFTQPSNGTVSRDDNGTPDNFRDDKLIYTPNNGFVNGQDTFTYTIADDPSLSNGIQSTDTATVTIGVFEEIPVMLEEEDNIFILTQDPIIPIQGDFQFTFEVNSRSANHVNEIGLVQVDRQNRVNGIDPDDPRYLAEVISESEVIFTSLTEKVQVDVESTRRFDFSPGDNLMLFLVQDDSIDSVEEKLATGAELPNIFFAVPEANADGFNHLQVEETNRIFELQWEDMLGGGDQDFDDFRMTLRLTDEQEAPGTNLQGDIELIDLREFNSLEAQFLVQSDANYQNTVGFYQVEDESGTISTFDTNGIATIFNPGDVGYARAAVENAIVSFDRNGTDNTSLSGLVAPFIITNATTDEFLVENPRNLRGREPLAFFPFLDANPDGFDHIRLLGDNTFGFEDLPDGGDFDFEDMIVEVDFA